MSDQSGLTTGQVLGAATAAAGSVAVLPATGESMVAKALCLLSIILGAICLFSFILTRLLRRVI